MAGFQTDKFKAPIYNWLFLLFLSVGASFIEGNRESYLAPIEVFDVHIRSFDKPKLEYGYVVLRHSVFHGWEKLATANRISLVSRHLTIYLRACMKTQASVNEYVMSNLVTHFIQIPRRNTSSSFPDFIF